MFSLESDLIVCDWQYAKPRLKHALGDYWQHAEQSINEGKEQSYTVGDTFMLLRGEKDSSGNKELVVVGLDGDMAAGTMAAINHARINNFDSIRAHFFRPGAERFIKRALKCPVFEVEKRGKSERVLRIRFNDMGGSSSSSNETTTTTTTESNSGTAAVSGDNWGANISGVSKSEINLTMTDNGAVMAAGKMAEEALNFGGLALASNSEVSSHAIDAIKSMAGQQSATTKAAIGMANAAKAQSKRAKLIRITTH
ncbi:hypothetical protein [Aliivibrio kagoshimensis]|uniref:hypothetical protein n=1 Tax=Aliivibrio kagoshimensis TaxID=2910230 RepID=UPI003D102EC9